MSVGRDQAAELLGALSSLVRSTRAAAQRHGGEMVAAGTPVALLKALRSGDTRASDLAGVLQVAPSVTSRTIVRLEQAGLVERRPDPADARASLIALTARGRQELDLLQQAYVEEVRSALDSWTDAEAAQAAALMTRLERAIADAFTATFTEERQRRLLAATSLSSDVDDDARTPLSPHPADTAVPVTTR